MTALVVVATATELPFTPCRCYVLDSKCAPEDAYRLYVSRFGVEPVQAWQWQNYLYIPVPEGN